MRFECNGWSIYFIPTDDEEVNIFVIDERIIKLNIFISNINHFLAEIIEKITKNGEILEDVISNILLVNIKIIIVE